MFTWFIEHAPIRTKFNFMISVYVTAVTSSAVFAYLAGSAESLGAIFLAGAALIVALTLAFGLITKRFVCDPYVSTVVRMEALAEGDTTSDIAYRHHTKDCVGRMARAMLTFKDNAESVRKASEQQEKIVAILSEALKQLARNDLSSTIQEPLPPEYETLRSNYNEAIAALRQTVLAVASTKESIDVGTSEISNASEDLSMRTQSQAESVERTLGEMNALSSEISKTASDAAHVNEAMAKAKQHAESSGEIVKQTVEAMARIERASSEIASFIEVIDGIAFQTNLLALNAGVEAARAGESGKGFAVVAGEVRALAQRASEASHDVKDKVAGSQREVETGVSLVGDTGKALERISKNIVEVTELISEISQSSQRQAGGLSKVNETLSNIEKMTQQNAAMCEETSAATRTLKQHARSLNEQVSQFKLSDGTSSAGSHGGQVQELGWAA
ncbi:methyl-accepting chemotaxis protein [Erythrobacter sp. SCSIO 43205]|uniref:methyl-accepting chemotaxis protein n=1 Tax=Erythrobacter sp. SCSIO 43205 TaxID=2779361 RepID=UPI001CA7EC32|nr:methyl-accepting chemotaxis protein [Erythrobacter sp. SCSIO 43205]UAB76878.1 methyl-accepting chemotaxis protein [Erythrobacter sp. SCSIO 43205]